MIDVTVKVNGKKLTTKEIADLFSGKVRILSKDLATAIGNIPDNIKQVCLRVFDSEDDEITKDEIIKAASNYIKDKEALRQMKSDVQGIYDAYNSLMASGVIFKADDLPKELLYTMIAAAFNFVNDSQVALDFIKAEFGDRLDKEDYKFLEKALGVYTAVYSKYKQDLKIKPKQPRDKKGRFMTNKK